MASPGVPRRAQATTLAEVAHAAGVSLATASKALNGKAGVKPATRVRVEEEAKRLGFFPNQQARSLMFGRSGSVGLLTTDLDGRFVLPVMAGVEDGVAEAEAVAIMVNTRGRSDLIDRHLTALLSRRVDGIIRVGDSPEPVAPLSRDLRVPVVYAYAPSEDERDVSIVSDHRGAGKLATEYLLSLGRTRIAHLGGPNGASEVGHTAALLRADGSAEAVNEVGLGLIGGRPLHGDWTESWGWAATGRLLDQGHEPDALVCANDQIARGAIDCLIARGLRIPQDVAVIGFDNWSPIAPLARLPQTSVDMNLAQLGWTAARAILDPANASPGVTAIPGRIVERASTVSAS